MWWGKGSATAARTQPQDFLTALYSVPCSQCYTCGLSQQSDTLHELSTLYRSASYLAIRHTRDIKRV
eukprot:COSAG02_NODE_51333_length_314_cov_4.888372_1_plen_66_part_10